MNIRRKAFDAFKGTSRKKKTNKNKKLNGLKGEGMEEHATLDKNSKYKCKGSHHLRKLLKIRTQAREETLSILSRHL